MNGSDPSGLLRGCGLPQAWAGQAAWRILDTAFDVLRLFAVWEAWQQDAQRPDTLHYVGLMPAALQADALVQARQAHPAWRSLADQLAPHCWGLLPGFHRILLAQGKISLTLCVGERAVLLREQHFRADSVWLDATDSASSWDRWDAKALARCCRRGTRLACTHLHPAQLAHLRQAGFEFGPQQACFNPRWDARTTREPRHFVPAPVADCVVVGAGLAGAGVAAALARRGWQVQVLDAAPAPAAGASGLPAGLVVPHVSADDSPRSRLSRAGVRLMLQQAAELLQSGQDWLPSGVLEHRVDKAADLPAAWPASGLEWSAPSPPDIARAHWAQGMHQGAPSLWHAHAGWIKPARLVQAWLAHSGIAFLGNSRVEAIRPAARGWTLLDAHGKVQARASHLVLANAGDASRLLHDLRIRDPERAAHCLHPFELQGLRGVLSWGLRADPGDPELPPFPVNGLGGLIPLVPTEQGLAWYAGATYESAQAPTDDAGHHRINRDKLKRLLPVAGDALAAGFDPPQVQGWSATRYASVDRLPWVGPLETGPSPSLWISAAMGSRGLSFAMLCAELLAARLGGEPLPVELSLATKLDTARPGKRIFQ